MVKINFPGPRRLKQRDGPHKREGKIPLGGKRRVLGEEATGPPSSIHEVLRRVKD